jgi:hypothetical protein
MPNDMSEPNNKEIMGAINGLAATVRSNTEAIQALASHVDEIHSDLHSEIGGLRFDMHQGFDRVEIMFREEDKKIDRLTEKLLFKKVISKKDTKEILALGAFPLQGIEK